MAQSPVIDPLDNVIDPRDKDAETVAELEKEIPSLEEAPEINHSYNPNQTL